MDESFFQQPSRTGAFHLPASRHAAAAELASQAGLRIFTAYLGRLADKSAVLEELGRRLGFPAWYGANFDALHDCLTDSDWAGTAGCALFLSGLDAFAASHPGDFAPLIEVLRAASEYWQEENIPFWILLDSGAPGLATLSEA